MVDVSRNHSLIVYSKLHKLNKIGTPFRKRVKQSDSSVILRRALKFCVTTGLLKNRQIL
jgi:hypothetical protein